MKNIEFVSQIEKGQIMKSYKLFFVTIFYIFIFISPSRTQFYDCFAPWAPVTFPLTINCNGNDFVVIVDLCYRCYITAYWIDIVVSRVSKIPAGCEVDVNDAINQWVIEHIAELCGNMPCESGEFTVNMFQPICGLMIYDPQYPGTYTKQLSPSCLRYCTWSFRWCWDNSVVPPRVRVTDVGNLEEAGIGECDITEVCNCPLPNQCSLEFNLYGETPWTIDCQKFSSRCDPDGVEYYWRKCD